ncbi:SCO family protein [Amaricoccus macauensis]|uniref:SCO family protein n=1 Tax=Amaricoccus macauensis TaxID=57001 RepID=UPI003C7D7488
MRKTVMAAALAGLLASPALGEGIPDLPAPSGEGLPFALGGDFSLTDQDGQRRTQADPAGRPQLLFFGYASCEQICSVALPMMADTVAGLEQNGIAVTPVMITVDPARDTPEVMGDRLRDFHPDFVGLTGSESDLARAYEAFNVEFEPVYVDPFYGEVFAHGSFVYLLDAEGRFLTLFPPILAPERVAEIVRSHIEPAAQG